MSHNNSIPVFGAERIDNHNYDEDDGFVRVHVGREEMRFLRRAERKVRDAQRRAHRGVKNSLLAYASANLKGV